MIHLKAIDQSNYKACIQLKTTTAQKDFVAANWYSLLESQFEEQRQAFGIYRENEMIGFIMFSYYDADEQYPVDSWWIERLMIDQRFQNKGYGRKALQKSIKWFEQNLNQKELRISAVFSNEAALHLYESLEFVRTGEEIDGEAVLLKKF